MTTTKKDDLHDELNALAEELAARLPENAGFVFVVFSNVTRIDDVKWSGAPSIFFANAPAQSVRGLLTSSALCMVDAVSYVEKQHDPSVIHGGFIPRPRKQ